MRALGVVIASGLLILATAGSVLAATVNFSQASVDDQHPFAVFVHQAVDGTLGAKTTWTKANCCANGHANGLTLTIALVDHPGDDYQEIDFNGEACSIGGSKPIACYVHADPFTKDQGFAPAGWYIVKVEQFNPGETEYNVKTSVYGNIDQTAPGPTVLYP